MEEIEKNWVKTAIECGNVDWLNRFGYDENGVKNVPHLRKPESR